MDSFLTLDSVCKSYRSGRGQLTEVVNNVSLEVNRGELIVFLGPSGCGKTTLMRIVGGLEKADGGSVRLENQPLGDADRRRGMVFQSYSCFPWLTVRENIAFALRYRKNLPGISKAELTDHYLGLVGLTEFADFYINRISGGMRQRVAIARTLAAKPDVLLMDEPFGALDALTREHLQMQLLEINREEQKATIFVTHDVDEAVLLGHKICIFSARPARIIETVNVAETIAVNNRGSDIRESPEFFKLRNHIHKILRAEYEQSIYSAGVANAV